MRWVRRGAWAGRAGARSRSRQHRLAGAGAGAGGGDGGGDDEIAMSAAAFALLELVESLLLDVLGPQVEEELRLRGGWGFAARVE
jgi:hypothetical protein